MSEPIAIHECDIPDDEYEIEYVLSEKEIFAGTTPIMYWPLRVFNLKGMGIDQRAFLEDIAPTFRDLPWDRYDMRRARIQLLHDAFPEEEKRIEIFNHRYYPGSCDLASVIDLIAVLPPEKIKEFHQIIPHRRRSLARFRVHKKSRDVWHVARIPAGNFSQSQGSGDFREEVRVFQEMSTSVSMHAGFQKLLMRLGQIVEGIHGRPEALEINVHQVTTVVRQHI